MGVELVSKNNIVACAIVGDGMVGKTSLALTFMKEKLPEKYVATVFNKFAGSQLVAGDIYAISILDTAGQQEYKGQRVLTYEKSEVIVMCYSAVDIESFHSVRDYWFHEILEHACGKKKKLVILVATQTDQRRTRDYNVDTQVSTSEGERLAKDIKAEKFIECSAVIKGGVIEVFEMAILCAVKKRQKKLNILKTIINKHAH